MKRAPILDAALAYAARGWPVFPVHTASPVGCSCPKGAACAQVAKHPRTEHGFKDASADETIIRAWFRRWPDANAGVPTGRATFDALDVDGEKGEKALLHETRKRGALPLGPWQRTGRGRQLIFTGGSLLQGAKFHDEIDARSDGGYVIVAPSVHRNGRTYEFHGLDTPIPDPPSWLAAWLHAGRASQPSLSELRNEHVEARLDTLTRALLEGEAPNTQFPLRVTHEGARDNTLAKWACGMRARNRDLERIRYVIGVVNEHLCSPPLASADLDRIARSAMKYQVSAQYVRAIERASLELERAVEDEEIRERRAVAATGDDDAARASISADLCIPFQNVVQRGRDSARYYIRLADAREIFVGPSLAKQAAVADALMRHGFGTAALHVPARRWRATLDQLDKLTIVDEDAEMERRGETEAWIATLLDEAAESSGLAREYHTVRSRLPHVHEGHIYVSPPFLGFWLRGRGVHIPHAEVVGRLKEAGFARWQAKGAGTVAIKDPDTGKAISRSYLRRADADVVLKGKTEEQHATDENG